MLRLVPILIIVAFSVACSVTRPMGSFTSVSVKERDECISICKQMDLRFGAVVIIRNSAGCVCEPAVRQPEKQLAGNAAVVGGAMIASEEEEDESSKSNTTQPNSATE